MTDAADAGNEDHADWAETGHVLRVVTGAARHLFRSQSEFFRRAVDDRADARVSRRRNVRVEFLEIESDFAGLRNLIRFGANLLIEHLDFRRIEVAQL